MYVCIVQRVLPISLITMSTFDERSFSSVRDYFRGEFEKLKCLKKMIRVVGWSKLCKIQRLRSTITPGRGEVDKTGPKSRGQRADPRTRTITMSNYRRRSISNG